MNLGLAVRAQPVGPIPEPPHASWTETPGAAGALVRRVQGDPFELERVDPAIGIEARDLLKAGVDDGRHAGNGERRLGDVRGKNDARPGPAGNRAVLLVRRKRAVQRQDVDAGTGRHARR